MASKNKRGCKQLISAKMRVLSDFGICDKHDEHMKALLQKAIDDKPDKDPGEVLDYYCRPMIQHVANCWI